MRDDLLGFAQELAQTYGDSASFRIGPVRVYQFVHPDQVNEALVKKSTSLAKPTSVKWYFSRWMGEGLLLSDAPSWPTQRRKVRWAMRHMPSAAHAAMAAGAAREHFARQTTDSIDLYRTMDRLAFYLISQAFFGERASEVFERFYAAADFLHHAGIEDLRNWSLVPDWIPTRAKRAMHRAMREYDEILLEHLARSHEARHGSRDLLSLLLRAEDRQCGTRGMSDRQARDEAANLLMGGKDTVAASLTWAAYMAAKHSDVQARMADEVQRVLGKRTATGADVPRLVYTKWVFQEAMRLYPPGYLLAREVRRPLTIGGYALRRGWQVWVPTYVIHRDARWWDDPDEFRPERFAMDERLRKRYTYLPFGAGPRTCVGRNLGYQQGILVLASLIQDHVVRLDGEQAEPELETDIVLHPKHAINVVLEPR